MLRFAYKLEMLQNVSGFQPIWRRLKLRNGVGFAVFRKTWFLRYNQDHGKLEPLFCLDEAELTLFV